MSALDTGIDIRQSAASMVEAYQQACKDFAEGLTLIAQGEERLNKVFGGSDTSNFFSAIDHNRRGWYGAERVQEYFKSMVMSLRRSCWRAIINHLQINKVASSKRMGQIRENIEKDKFDEITLPAIYDLLESFRQNAGEMMTQTYKEAYDALRPYSHWRKELVTNQKSADAGVGKKVILSWVVEVKYSNDGFRLNYHSSTRDKINAIDRAFHLLDGKQFASENSYRSPLADAIETCGVDGKGQTDYFSFQCYINGNLHLTFRRPDLVSMLNQICSDGATLKSGKFTKTKQSAFV